MDTLDIHQRQSERGQQSDYARWVKQRATWPRKFHWGIASGVSAAKFLRRLSGA